MTGPIGFDTAGRPLAGIQIICDDRRHRGRVAVLRTYLADGDGWVRTRNLSKQRRIQRARDRNPGADVLAVAQWVARTPDRCKLCGRAAPEPALCGDARFLWWLYRCGQAAGLVTVENPTLRVSVDVFVAKLREFHHGRSGR